MSAVARAKRAVNGVRVWLWADDAEGEFQALLSPDMARELLGQLAAALEGEAPALQRHDDRPALPGRWNAPEGPAWGTPELENAPSSRRNGVAPQDLTSSEVPKEEDPQGYVPSRPYFTTFSEHGRLTESGPVIDAALTGFSRWTRVAMGRPEE